MLNKMNEFYEKINGNKHLTLVPFNKTKEKIKYQRFN